MGVVSLTGVPWKVLNDTAPIDCSGWPAGMYTVSMQYTNGLGFGASTSLDVTILNHPAPAFDLIVTGDNQRMGTGCAVEAVIDENSTTSMLTYGWEVTDPRGLKTETSDINDIDCGLWVPGVHKIRVTATNAQMQTATMGVNLVRLPPIDSNDPTLGNITDDGTWPDASSGDDYEPVPLFMNVQASAGAIAGSGVLIGILLGVFVGLLMRRILVTPWVPLRKISLHLLQRLIRPMNLQMSYQPTLIHKVSLGASILMDGWIGGMELRLLGFRLKVDYFRRKLRPLIHSLL